MAAIQFPTYLNNRLAQRFAFIVLPVLFSVFLGGYLTYRLSAPQGVILKGVQVAGVPVGGMRVSEASQLLQQKLRKQVERPVHLVWESNDEFLLPADMGIAADVDVMLARALTVGRKGSILQQLGERFRVHGKGYQIPLAVKGNSKLDRYLRSLGQRIDRKPIDASLVTNDSNIEVVPGTSGLAVNLPKLRHNLLVATTQSDREVVVPVEVKEPDITTSELRSWGIRNVVAKFDTRYKAADVNRTHNLRIAAQALNGAVVPPGATFSFNKRVGPRAENSGYKEAPVVINGELVPDIGGGVCQVSTTLYNAVLLAGLRVDARQPHTIPSSYVPLGLDAAVAYDYKDFRFTNTTTQHLYIKAWLENGAVRVTLLGTNTASKVKLVSKVEEVIPFPVKQITDPTLPAGKRVTEHKGGKGYTVTTWRVSGAEGNERWQQIGRSKYQPRPQVLRIGTGAVKPANSARAVSSTSASSSALASSPQG